MNAPKSCPTCGTTLGPSHADALSRCDACQQLNPRGFHYCGFCAALMHSAPQWTSPPIRRDEGSPGFDHAGPDAITQPLPSPDAITKPEPIPPAVQAQISSVIAQPPRASAPRSTPLATPSVAAVPMLRAPASYRVADQRPGKAARCVLHKRALESHKRAGRRAQEDREQGRRSARGRSFNQHVLGRIGSKRKPGGSG